MTTNPQGSPADMREVNRVIAETQRKQKELARILAELERSGTEKFLRQARTFESLAFGASHATIPGAPNALALPVAAILNHVEQVSKKLATMYRSIPSEAQRANALNSHDVKTIRSQDAAFQAALGINEKYANEKLARGDKRGAEPFLENGRLFRERLGINQQEQGRQGIKLSVPSDAEKAFRDLVALGEATDAQTTKLHAQRDAVEELIIIEASRGEGVASLNTKLQENLDISQTNASAQVDAGRGVIAINDELAETIAYINSLTEERSEADQRAVAAAAEAALAMQAVWDSAGKEISGVWENNWKSLLKGNLDAFDSFAQSVLGIGKNLANGILDQIGGALAQQTGGLFSALLGGTSGNSSGGLFGLLNGTGFTPSNGWSGLFNNSTMSSSVLPNFAQSQWGGLLGLSTPLSDTAKTFMANTGMQLRPQLTVTGKAFNNLTSGWGIAGGIAGSALSNLLFDHRQGPGSQIGGTIGSIAGSFIPVPFLGTALGSFVGSTIGGMFGPRPSDQTEGTVFDLFNAANDREGNLGPNKRSVQNKEMADTIEAAIRQLRDVMTAAGLNPLARGGLIEVGSGNSLAPFRASLDASGVQNFKTREEAFAFLARGLVNSLETVPEELQAAVDGFNPSNLQAFIAALAAVVNDENAIPTPAAGEEGPLGDPSDIIGHELPDDAAEVLDEVMQDVTDAAENSARAICGVEEIEGRRRADIVKKYADETADIHEQRAAAEKARLEEQATRVASILDEILQKTRESLSARLNALAEERRVIEDNIGTYKSVLASVKSAQARLARDPRISPVSNEQRLADLMRQLNEAAAKAQNGDMEAAAEVADLAMAAAEANVAFNASSEEGARVQGEIARILENTGSVADRQLQVAELSLQANQAQVDLLEQYLNSLANPAQKGPISIADMLALQTAYTQANGRYNFSGMTSQQLEADPVWKGVEAQLFDYISRLENTPTAVDWLKNTLAWAPAELDTNFEFAARRRVLKLMDRLRDFGITPIRPPGFAAGGRTGHLALVHPNEMIYTGPPAMVYNARETASMMSGGNVLRELQGIRADIGVLSRTVSITGEDQVVQLSRHDMRLAAIESNFSLARARA